MRKYVLLIVLILAVTMALPVYASTLRDYYNTGEDNNISCYGAIWYGQTFTISGDSYKLDKVKVRMYKSGNPTSVTVAIRATSSGLPTGSNLGSCTLPGSSVTSTVSPGSFVEFTISGDITLTNGVKYALIYSAVGDTSNKVRLMYDSTSPTYSNGNWLSSVDSGSSFTADLTKDGMFEVYGNPAYGSVSGVTSFNAEHISVYQTDLSWTRSANATAVRIIRDFDGYVTDPDGAFLVYDGSASSFSDEGWPYYLPAYYSIWEYNPEYWQDTPDTYYIGGEPMDVTLGTIPIENILPYILFGMAILCVLVNVFAKNVGVSVAVIAFSVGAVVASASQDASVIRTMVQFASIALIISGVIGAFKHANITR